MYTNLIAEYVQSSNRMQTIDNYVERKNAC